MMTSRWIVGLVLAGAWIVNAETVVDDKAPAVTTGAGQESVATPVPVPVLEPIAAEPAGPITGVDEADFSLERFSIGTRITHYELKTNRKDNPTFLGHINQMEAIQDHAPTKLYADWWFCRYSGLELTWDHVKARTHNEDPEGISDGNMIARGPIATVMLRYPNTTRVTPHVGVGMAFMSVSFDEEPWWALGYASPQDYEDLGRPAVARGKTREMLPKDSANGVVVVAGLDVRLTQHWSADLYWRDMDLDTEMGYRTAGDVKSARTIPLGNTVMGAGVKYVF